MMRRSTILFLLLAFPLTLGAQQPKRGTAEAEFGGKKISIEYGRPVLRGRDMLGQAADGMVWRTGMDEATTLASEAPLAFGSVTVAAGKYSLFVRKVSAEKWELLVNSETGIWGTNHNPARDIATVPLRSRTNSNSVETFVIKLDSKSAGAGTLSMAWGTTELAADFVVR